MKIIKRNGAEEDFDINKIVVAVSKANVAAGKSKLSMEQIKDIADYVEYKCDKLNRAVSVEEIQDMVENQIMSTGAFELAKDYVRYRFQRSLIRKANTTDNRILSLIECNNEDVKQENSNKNPTVNSVQRDYMAGEVSKDLISLSCSIVICDAFATLLRTISIMLSETSSSSRSNFAAIYCFNFSATTAAGSSGNDRISSR